MAKKFSLMSLGLLVSLVCGLSNPNPIFAAPKKKAKQVKNVGITSTAVKAFITRKEKMLATGIGSTHKSVVVTFESVRLGASRKANLRDRTVNGITGPIIYPARVKYTSLRTWGNGETESVPIHYDYEFYKDAYGSWDAYMVGPVR
jgi:hypothetical protein